MNILIFSGNWDNRGDESAIRAMIDEMIQIYPNVNIKIQFNVPVKEIPYENIELVRSFYKPAGRNKFKLIPYYISVFSGGRINLLIGKNRRLFNEFLSAVKWADLALYAPGGPNIGDFYRQYVLLDMIHLMYANGVPYAFYAPSMGPFKQYKKRISRMLSRSSLICLRESISERYLLELNRKLKINVTLDSAFQHKIDEAKYQRMLEDYVELNKFLSNNKKVVGITISDLKWHKLYKNSDLAVKIHDAFSAFIQYLVDNGYGVVFIPQLFANASDKKYMSDFSIENCFVVDDNYDCYFQQYLISKLYAVVGMRYHSNIFSAKMGTPFVSVAYEQKMKGFMKKIQQEKYCIDISDLSFELLKDKFEILVKNYDDYKNLLMEQREYRRLESYKTTELVTKLIAELNIKN